MSHQTTLTSTNSTGVTTQTFNGLVTGDPIGVSITPLVGSGGNSSVAVSSTTNCSATTSAITATASSGTYDVTFSNLYIHVPGVLTIYAYSRITGTITAATSAPTHVTLSAAGTEAQSTTNITATTWGGTAGGTLYVSGTPFTTWVTNGYSWSGKTRGTTYTFKGKRQLNGVDSTYASNSITVPYLATSTTGTISAGDTSPAYTGSTSTVTLTIGNKAAGHDYYVDGVAIGTATSVSKTLPAAGGSQATYTLTVVRPTSYGGNGSTVSDGSVTVTRDAATAAPVVGSVANNDADSATVTATVTLSSSGSGGTGVEYSNGSVWQSSASFTQARNSTVSYSARRSGINLVSNSVSHTVGYKATSTAGTISASPTNPSYTGSTSTITVSIGNKATGHDYYVDGSGIGSATSVSKTLPAAGGSQATYVLTVVRPTSYGGNGSTVSDGSVTVTRQADPGSAPYLSSVTNNNESQPIPTATVNLSSSGSGGTLQYAQTSSNSAPSSGWQTSASFSHARPTTKYYWARQSPSLVSSSLWMTANYLTGDTSVSATNDTISSSASSASTTISNGTSGETYAVRLNNGSTNIVTRVGNGSLTIPSASLPTGTNTTTYEIFVLRPTSTGGDGSTYTATNDTFTVTRAAANNPNPNAFTFSNVPAATEGTVITSNSYTLAGMDVASTVTALNNCSYRIGSGSWQTSTGTAVPANSQITIRTTSSSTYGATVTAYVTVGTTQSTTWSVTTRSNPASSTYGLQVMNANGTNEIFGYNVSTSHIVAHGSISVPHSSTVTVSNAEGMLVGNANTVGVSVSATVPLFGIYLTHSRGTGQFTISNSSTLATVVARYMVFRY